jgi:hypothetical protein
MKGFSPEDILRYSGQAEAKPQGKLSLKHCVLVFGGRTSEMNATYLTNR